MSDPATVLDPGRAAHASIHGYLYQAWLGVERWLELKEDEILRCEGDEDLDRLLRDGSGGWSEQVKALTGDINIRDHVVQETLRRFAVSHHRLRTAEPPEPRRFVFTSTSTRRTQKTDDRLPVDVLAEWNGAKTDDAMRAQVVEALRTILPIAETEDRPASRLFREQIQEAVAWLEGDTERWADLIRAVEWRLGEPQLTEVRGRIDQAVNRLRPGAPPNLRERLLAEVLEASIAPEPRDRCRTRERLVALLDQADTEVARWMATSRGHGLVRRLEELDNLRGVLFDKPLALPPSPRPGQLLTAAYEVIPFDETGRKEILEDLAHWCADERKGLVRLIYGDGGLGKTRLLIEWCRRLAAQGWLTGFLQPEIKDHELPRLREGTLPHLVVIDYAETRLDAVRFLVSRLAHTKDGPKTRLILLARRAGDWWQTLKTDAATEDLLESTQPSPMPPFLSGLEERHKAFRAAALAFTPYLKEAPPSPPAEPNLTEEAFGRPLYLHMAALAAAQGQPVARAEEALSRTLAREQRYWQEEVQDLDDDIRLELEEALPTAVTVLTLLGGLSERGTQELSQRLLPEGGKARIKLLAKLVHRLYSAPSGSGRQTGGLEPDLLGEELVWDVLRHDSAPLHSALDLAEPAGHKQLLTVLTRIAQRPDRATAAEAWLKEAFETKLDDLAEPALEVAVALGDPIGPLLAQVVQGQASLELATWIMNRCDGKDLQDSVPLREVAFSSTHRVYAQLRERQKENAAEADTEEAQGELARVSFNLGRSFSDLGWREEALQATQEATDLYRLLTQLRPAAFRPYLATSFNSLGIRFSSLGRCEEALQATKEAADLFRLLAQQQPDAFRPDLAISLNNLGSALRDLGRREEAFQASQESADLYHQLAQQRPGTFSADLAMSLNNLSIRLGDLGRREEALQAAQEAVGLYRQLTGQRPDVFRPDLAMSLNNLGSRLSDLGRHEEALQAAQEAVEIRRLLAQQRPEAFRPDLANSLNSLGAMLSNLGRREDALQAAQEAAGLYRQLAHQRPDAFRQDLAKSLNNLGNSLSDLGRCDEALKAAQEATDLYRQLAQQRPEVFRPYFATSLNNLGAMLSDLGYREEALQAAQEGVAIRRLLAQQSPDAFRPNLAIGLANLSINLRNAGRPEEALAAAEEGARTLAPSFLHLPQAFEAGMTRTVLFYRKLCEELDREPDLELLGPIEAALASLMEEQS